MLSCVSIDFILLQNTRDWVIYKEQKMDPQLPVLACGFTHCQREEDRQVQTTVRGEELTSPWARIPLPKQLPYPTLLRGSAVHNQRVLCFS